MQNADRRRRHYSKSGLRNAVALHPALVALSSGAIEPLLLTGEEAARLLSLGRSMVYELMNRGEILSIHIGTARRIPLAGLGAW